MIKQILGEERGLILSTEKKDVFISPAKKNKMVLNAKNTTEYDMQLFMSFMPSSGTGCPTSEFDFFVPAEGASKTEISVETGSEARMYFGYTVAELTVRDRVLEWQNTYEIPMFFENVFKCSEKCGFCASDEMAVSNGGVIYLCKGEYAMMLAASEDERDIGIGLKSGACPKILADEKPCKDIFTLNKGLTRLCFYAEDDTAFYFKDLQSDKLICLNTVNPKYFI